MVLTTLGVGAARSPRFAPAGLLVKHGRVAVMIDGGPGSAPPGRVDAWLVSDERAELMGQIRRLARGLGVEPRLADFNLDGLSVRFHPVVHTSHLTGGYMISAAGRTAAWAPEFWRFPRWAAAADLVFAEASGWSTPIRFAGHAGGHMDALTVAAKARALGVKRLVFAHIGRPVLRAIDRGERPPFGQFARDGQVFRLTSWLQSS